MGQEIVAQLDPEGIRSFTKALLTDLQALDRMVAEDRIESGIRRIGAEQEVFLVGSGVARHPWPARSWSGCPRARDSPPSSPCSISR